jgi:hypothetical protein
MAGCRGRSAVCQGQGGNCQARLKKIQRISSVDLFFSFIRSFK